MLQLLDLPPLKHNNLLKWWDSFSQKWWDSFSQENYARFAYAHATNSAHYKHTKSRQMLLYKLAVLFAQSSLCGVLRKVIPLIPFCVANRGVIEGTGPMEATRVQ